jgi:hypothetical protein
VFFFTQKTKVLPAIIVKDFSKTLEKIKVPRKSRKRIMQNQQATFIEATATSEIVTVTDIGSNTIVNGDTGVSEDFIVLEHTNGRLFQIRKNKDTEQIVIGAKVKLMKQVDNRGKVYFSLFRILELPKTKA